MASKTDREQQEDSRSERLLNEKPCFSTSDKKIFMNLHNAAMQKASQKLQNRYGGGSIHEILINTGLSEDGRTLNPNTKIKDGNNIMLKYFGSSDQKYEVGLVLQYTDFTVPTSEQVNKYGDFNKAFLEVNKDGLGRLNAVAFETLHEYFKFFADTDAQREKMIEFIPDYNGEKIRIDGYKIVPMDGKKAEQYLRSHSNRNAPRLGYKFGYSLIYQGEE